MPVRGAQRAGEAREDLEQVVGHLGDQVRLLPDDRDLVGELQRVVGADLGAEAVLERRDDAAAVGVVLGVRAGDDQHVERQPQHVAADLDVALLHHVEHRHLDALGEVGQLVDGDDAAVAARDEAEVDGLRVAEAAALGHLHGVDVADEVGDAGVGRGELLGVALGRGAATPPAGRRRARPRGAVTPPVIGSYGCSPQLGALDDRRPLVEQADEAAQQAGLALAALAEQHHVVAGEQGPLELRDHGGVEAVDARPRVAALLQRGQQVRAELLAQVQLPVSGGAQLAERPDGRGWRGRDRRQLGKAWRDRFHGPHGTSGRRSGRPLREVVRSASTGRVGAPMLQVSRG